MVLYERFDLKFIDLAFLNPPSHICVNKEICFISRPGDGLSYCCFQSEPNPKPMPGMERNGKIIVAGVGKQRFDV